MRKRLRAFWAIPFRSENAAGHGHEDLCQWVRSPFQGWADWILVAEVDERIAGYGLWRKPSEIEAKNSLNVAHCDLAAIDPEFLGRGLWTALMFDGMGIAHVISRNISSGRYTSAIIQCSTPCKNSVGGFPAPDILFINGWTDRAVIPA